MAEKVTVKLGDLEQALHRSERAVYEPGFEARIPGNAPSREQFLIELREWQRTLETNGQKQNVFGSLDDRGVSLLQSYLAREGSSHGGDIQPTKDGFEAKFDNLDPGWIWSLHDWIKGLRKHDFLPAPLQPDTIANDYQIAVLSDWGTGLYGAPVCAKSIENHKENINMVLHLGDIYYAGDDDEVKERFLAYWPQRPGATNRALSGNHEMYTGGKAYFNLILKDPTFNQPASYFALRNDHWLVVALDTGYEEHDLYGGQAAWLEKLAAESPGQKILLFSHHQPFSYFESQGLKLVHKLAPLLVSGRVAAWYWGHEHSCTRYDLHCGWKMYGRCVGHSGFPYFRFINIGSPHVTQWVPCAAKGYIPGCLVLDGPNPYVHEQPNAYGPNGYVILHLCSDRVHEAYYDPEGKVLDEFEFGKSS
jgi:hypothetical protein